MSIRMNRRHAIITGSNLFLGYAHAPGGLASNRAGIDLGSFGVKGDGKSDDSAAFRAALEATANISDSYNTFDD